MGDEVDGCLGVGDAEVVEHDAVHAAVAEHLPELVEVSHFDFYLQVEVVFLEIGVAAVDGFVDASGKVDVVVLEQNHVEESDAMVASAANLDGLLLEHAQAGGGLAGVEHAGVGAFETLDVAVGGGGDAAHALHDVEHEALGLE